MIIDGKALSENILGDLRKKVGKLKITPHLYIISLSVSPQTSSYIKQKLLKAEKIGAKITVDNLNPNISASNIKTLIEKLNIDKKVNGIIVQRPLSKTINDEELSLYIDPKKDVDGFHPHSNFSTPVALAVLKLLETVSQNQDITDFLKSKKITVLGKGITAGRPIINLFKKLNIKIKVIDSKTKDRKKILKSSDIIISAVGKKNAISFSDIKKHAILIGVGLHLEKDKKLHGDFEEKKIAKIASYYSPTPGGVGPLNVTFLMKNLVDAAQIQNF